MHSPQHSTRPIIAKCIMSCIFINILFHHDIDPVFIKTDVGRHEHNIRAAKMMHPLYIEV